MINFKEASGRVFFHFLEVFEKCIEYIRIFFIHFGEISKFWEEVICFRSIIWLISWSLQDDQGGITCMEFIKYVFDVGCARAVYEVSVYIGMVWEWMLLV